MKFKFDGVFPAGLLIAALLGGCHTLPPVDAPPPVLPAPEQVRPVLVLPLALPSAADDVMELIDRFGRASPAELSKEYDILIAIPDPDRGGTSLLRLALLLSQSGLPFRDDAAAVRVLQEWEKRQPAADPALKSFVHWLRGMLGERIRLAGNMEECGNKLRDEKKRAETCKDKLDAIKDMEKSLIERDKH